MSSIPSGPGGVQRPVSPDSSLDIQKKPNVSGKHGHRKVEETTVEKQIQVKSSTPPRKRLSEFNNIKPVTPEPSRLKPEAGVKEPPEAPEDQEGLGVDTRRGDARYKSREDIIKAAKKTRKWQKLESQITKKGGLTSKKRFAKLLADMPRMDFSDKKRVTLMALFAIEKHDSGQFTKLQMIEYMNTLLDCYTTAKAEEQVQQALFLLPKPPKKGDKPLSPGRAAILAEIAAMTAERSKGADAHEATFRALKTNLQMDLYDQDSEFLETLTASFDGWVPMIDKKIAEGMHREMTKVIQHEAGGKKRKPSAEQLKKMAEDVDLITKQFVESQLREKKQKIDGYVAEGQSSGLTEDGRTVETDEESRFALLTKTILKKAEARRAGMVTQLTQGVGSEFKTVFEQHDIPEHRQPGNVLKLWLKNNEAAKEVADAREAAQTEAQSKRDTPAHEVDAWVDHMVELIPEEQKHKVDDEFKDELREGLELATEAMDIVDGLLPAPDEPSPFSRNDPLRRGMKWKAPDPFKPAPKTVTESLEAGIKKELARRAARRAEIELQNSRSRPEPEKTTVSSVVPEKKTAPKVAPKPVRQKQNEQASAIKHRELERDVLVPTLVRQFEQIIKQEQKRAEGINRPVPPGSTRSRD